MRFVLHFRYTVLDCCIGCVTKKTQEMFNTPPRVSVWVCPSDGASTHGTIVGVPQTGKLTQFPAWHHDDRVIGSELVRISDLVPLQGQIVVVRSPGQWVAYFLALRPDVTVRYTNNWSWCPQCSEEVIDITAVDTVTHGVENMQLS